MSLKTKLAELAGTNKLAGKVCVTDARGVTHHYKSEAEAEAAWGSKVAGLAHKRGAFFEVVTARLKQAPSSTAKVAPRRKDGDS